MSGKTADPSSNNFTFCKNLAHTCTYKDNKHMRMFITVLFTTAKTSDIFIHKTKKKYTWYTVSPLHTNEFQKQLQSNLFVSSTVNQGTHLTQ